MKIAYVRVSTQEQNEARQIEALEKEGIEEWFTEKISGKDTNEYTRIPTVEEFKQRKIYGKYTPLTLDDIIKIQEK